MLAEMSEACDVPYLVIDDFLPAELAARMRADIEGHFATPGTHQPQTHQIWNYWFVPGLYTYLRTIADRVIAPGHMDRFMEALDHLAATRLGLKVATRPYLSMYVDGCRQALHNDAKNGLFAFVYSLTKDMRKSIGGETVILDEGDLFRRHLTTAAAGQNFYSEIAPRFNRLVIFDDRIPHGVSLVEGPMDPVEGRFVLHGHIVDDGPRVEGGLSADSIGDAIIDAVTAASIAVPENIAQYHGPLVLHFTIGPDGAVQSMRKLVDRVIGPRDDEWHAYVHSLMDTRTKIEFSRSSGITTVTEPIVFGNPPG